MRNAKKLIGDTIIFTNTDTSSELRMVVVGLNYFDNFEELYKNLPLLQCGYTEENVKNAKFSDMEKYYSVEEQEKYGVVGIEICQPKQVNNLFSKK